MQKRREIGGGRLMRWEDCIKSDLESAGGEWRTTAKEGIGDW